MKLTEIQIDRHGVWRNLTLPVGPGGLSVFYGLNEAGKTTLRHFIRSVLFGYSNRGDESSNGTLDQLLSAGSLRIEDASGSYRIHRAARGAMAAEPRLITDEAAHPSAAWLEGVLKGIDERIYERIFAIGLSELTEVNSLAGDEVAQHLFGISLGPAGSRILEAARRIEERRAALIDPLQKDGELVSLFERHDELTARLLDLAQLQERHSEWSLRRDQLELEIADLRKRLAGISEQFRGHAFLEQVWGPWNRIRECRDELDGLPEVSDFPERALERLEKLENEIAEAAECRDRLLAEVRQMRAAVLHGEQEAPWRAHSAAMRGFVEQCDWLTSLHQRRLAAQQTCDARAAEVAAACEQMGVGWTEARIEAVEISAVAQRRLSGTAESFLSAKVRCKAIQRKCRRIAGACRDLKESLAESLHDLDGRTIDTALAQTREQIAEANKLASLLLREAELAQRVVGLDKHREQIAPQLNLPRWVYVVLGVFAFMGVILAGWGLVAGVATSGIAGTIYTMLGITCGGLAWGLKIQYEGDAQARLAEFEAGATAAVSELKTLREVICQLRGDNAVSDDPSEIVCRAQGRISELVELAANQRRLCGMRRKLAGLRKKLATARREVGTARHHWNELLARLGFPEALPIDEALAAWQILVDAAERLSACKQARHELQTVSGICDGYRKRIEDLARRLPENDFLSREPLEILADWENQLGLLDLQRNDRRDLRRRLRLKRREVREFNKRVEAHKHKRNALLVQGGAANSDEFEERARSFARATFLEDQLQDAQHDLDVVCAEYNDLAVVEEDLEGFDARQNSECIETLRLELADLERDLEQAFEHLGGVKHEIESLENDTQATKVRFELRKVEDQLCTLTREWAVCESAARAIDDMRRDFEHTHQPQALAEASTLFSRMTCGKYVRVWAPLGERLLFVEDDEELSHPVQSLSRGTREQLLLAVRLAVVREMTRQGISLPVILDDVIVNFDEDRASATVDVLCELAEEGQQVLFFTCHKHLAELFASRGIEPIWLPNHVERDTERDEKRKAG